MMEGIVIREMGLSEQGSVRALFKRCLGPIDLAAFSIAFCDVIKSIKKRQGCCLVAVQGGAVVGTMSLRTFTYGGRRAGLVDAVASDRAVRGRGVAKAMLATAIGWFEARGYPDVYATVDRYNSPSWNMFVHAGFKPYEFPDQVRDFGGRFLKLWADEGHLFGFGTFFLKRSATRAGPAPRASPGALHLLAACTAYSLLWIVVLFRGGGASLDACLAAVVVASSSVVLPEAGHAAMARALGLRTCFKAWSSGFWFMLALGIVGGIYPAYGSTYVAQLDWSYTRNRRETGLVYVVGPIVNAITAVASRLLASLVGTGAWRVVLDMAFTMNLWLAIFNILPIKSAGGMPFDGYKIFTWSKAAWGVLAGSVVGLFIAGYLHLY
ncbi:MAG: GNAT family N-acetyltransferase [Candidatus Lokiarchaeota archaeon]|nr:GNAT family N-acetyltransferase [Candidatus Lokiarchaeota archaeon]